MLSVLPTTVAVSPTTREMLLAPQRPQFLRAGEKRVVKQAFSPLVLLPQDQGDASPACLDGSAYGFYYVPAADPSSTLWTMWFEGGGWCYDEAACLARARTSLGSSDLFEPTGTCRNWNVANGAMTTNAHCVFMRYCDGASFSGFRPGAHSMPGTPENSGPKLTFRGARNLDATLEWALHHGLANATQFVLAGGSAGGHATFLHADRAIARVREAVPDVQAWATSVGGYFIDHDNAGHTVYACLGL